MRLAAACSKFARTSVKVKKPRLLPLVLPRAQRRVSEQPSELITRRVSEGIKEVHLVTEMTRDR